MVDRNKDSHMDELKTVLEQRREAKQKEKPKLPPPPTAVSLGPVDKIVDVLINPTPDKILEFTDFDRNQVSLIPQVLVVDDMWNYIEQVLQYRSDKDYYEERYEKKMPETPATARKFVLLVAQCRRSLGGKTQKALEDLALADLETKARDEGFGFGDGFEDDK